MVGTHIIVDSYLISDTKFYEIHHNFDTFNEIIKKLIQKHNMTLISNQFKIFDGQIGAFTLLYLLSESHISFHSWPEKNYIAIDVFTCGDCNTRELVKDILNYLECNDYRLNTIHRGMDTIKKYI